MFGPAQLLDDEQGFVVKTTRKINTAWILIIVRYEGAIVRDRSWRFSAAHNVVTDALLLT